MTGHRDGVARSSWRSEDISYIADRDAWTALRSVGVVDATRENIDKVFAGRHPISQACWPATPHSPRPSVAKGPPEIENRRFPSSSSAWERPETGQSRRSPNSASRAEFHTTSSCNKGPSLAASKEVSFPSPSTWTT